MADIYEEVNEMEFETVTMTDETGALRQRSKLYGLFLLFKHVYRRSSKLHA